MDKLEVVLTSQDDDGKDVDIKFDASDPDSFRESVRKYARLEAAKEVKPLQAEIEQLKTDNKDLKDLTIGEMVRIRKLAGGDDFDVENETSYLTGLSPDRLKMEMDRTPKAESLDIKSISNTPEGDGKEKELVTVEAIAL